MPPCYCRLGQLCNILGKTYALRILGLLRAGGSLRYSELEAGAHAASSATVIARLDELATTDLLERRSDEIPPRVEDSLTPRGKALTERLQPLVAWVAAGDG